jgi:hypothetical protein
MYSFPLFEKLKAALPEFEQVAAFQAGAWQFSVRREAVDRLSQSLRGEFVTGNYFSTFLIRSFAGRLISDVDDRPAAPPVAVLSHRAWQTIYGGDPSVIGASYIVERHPFTIIGIAPADFFGETLRSYPPDIWLPLARSKLSSHCLNSLQGSDVLVKRTVANIIW